MPSKFTQTAFGTVTLLASLVLGQGTPETCSNTQLSCHNTTAINTCCINSPGGVLLQTQFWDYNPSTGPTDSWTIHGLWPDNCDGTYNSNCDSSRDYTNITQILQSFGQTDLLSYMQQYWVSDDGTEESFWEHEWSKHGTCISTLDPDCYNNYEAGQEVVDFAQTVVSLFKNLDTYTFLSNAGITPSDSQTYDLSDITSALENAFGGGVVVQCDSNGALDEAWYFYNVQGSIQSGTFDPTAVVGSGSSCSSTGIKYPPKSGGGGSTSSVSPTSTPTSTPTSSPTSTPTPTGSFSGSGYLNVYEGGSQDGCLISYGTWYTTGTCATYTATKSGSGFTLQSSKGSCAVSSSDGSFSCSSSVSNPTVFGSSSDGYLTYQGSSAFSAKDAAKGSTQETVYTGSGSVNIKMTWQNV